MRLLGGGGAWVDDGGSVPGCVGKLGIDEVDMVGV